MSSDKSATPATPSRGNGAPNATRTPGQSMLPHPTEESAYEVIDIHTAICTLCDARNMDDKMRRCPTCGWKICGACRDKRGNDFRHGIDITSTGKANRKPLPQATGRTPKRKATPVALEHVKPAPAAKNTSPDTTPASSVQQKLKDAAQEATPPTSGEKRRRPAKPTQDYDESDMSDLSDAPEDDEFLPESPSLGLSSRKRQKTTMNIRTKTNATSGSPVKRTQPTRQKKSNTSELGFSSTPKELDVAKDEVQGMKPSDDEEAMAAFYGTDAYKEHPLARSRPIPNRMVRIPLAVQRWNKPRKSAVEIQSDIQEKVGQKLVQQFGWPPRPGVASASESSGPVHQPRTIRDAVDAEAQSFCQQCALNAEQMGSLASYMEEAALKVRDDAFEQIAGAFRKGVAPGLGMDWEMLNKQQQQALTEALHKAAKEALQAVATGKLQEMPTTVSAERSTLQNY